MLPGDVKRKKIMPADVMNVVERRGKPEVHLHLAVTFVWGGDPMAIDPDDRDQKEIELKQFAARMKYGVIRNVNLEQTMREFQEAIAQTLRGSGALKGGE